MITCTNQASVLLLICGSNQARVVQMSDKVTGAARGGYRPGAGRPKTVVKARLQPGEVLHLERVAAQLGCEVDELAGYLLRQAMNGRDWPLSLRDVRRPC